MNTLRQILESLSRLRQVILLIIMIMMCGVSEVMGAITPTTPTVTDGVYQIGTAAELWGFAQGVNNGTIAVSANAKLTCETSIDLGGSENGSFPGIGSSSKKYTGTFDGNGKTISGFYRSTNTNVTGTGFFNYTNTGAVIKNFTLEGEMVLTPTNSIYAVGTVAGLPTGTTFEDVTSSVTLTLVNVPSGARIFGGMFGRVTSCTINRCRYNGTIDASASTAFNDRLGGIAGDGNSTFNNCLFDGEIIVGATSNLKVAGILVAPNNPSTINNSLFAGKITFPAGAALSTNCGPIAGNGGNNITVNQSYYWTKGITKGGAQASGYLTTRGTAIDTDTPDWSTITSNLNTAEATNWMIKAGKDYPVPAKGHAHNYVNGICTNSNGCTQQLQPCTVAADGYYEIANTGNLLWFGKGINDQSIAANSNARLTESITDHNMPLPEFSGIGTQDHPFAGILDGNHKTIQSTFYTANGTGAVGMFAYLEGTAEKIAIIKDLTLEGTFNVSAAREGIGALVGYMGDYTSVENIHSHVDINVTNADAKYIGGIIGIMKEKAAEQTKINLACYHNTINVTESTGPVGGIVGDMRGGTIENALFDGTIKTANTTNDLVVGGLAGQNYKASGANKTSYIQNSLSYGTITATDAASTKLGSVMGLTNQTVTSYGENNATFYKNNGAAGAFGDATSGQSLSTFTEVGTMTMAELRTALGATNWADGTTYPTPATGGTHDHEYNGYGFCVANDGTYQEATRDGDYYIIDNAGKLYWFAHAINAGTIATNSKAKVTDDLNLFGSKWGVFPMIGNETHKYTGEFDGQGHTISNLQIYTEQTGSTKEGMFIAASGANIHDFTVNGTFYIANSPGNTHGGITGETNGAKYEDINCAINVQCLAEYVTVSEIGGFAGLANGGSVINRCRYSGTMTVKSGVATGESGKTGDTHDAIGGMFGKTNNATITNCLFDGTITPASTNSDLNVGGIIGYAESATTLKNSFSHGTITLPSGTYSKCGTVVGRGALATSDKLYYTGTLLASGSISAESFTNVTGNSTIYSASGLVYSLGDANWYLAAASEAYYPVPKEGTHTHYYENGFCISDGSYEEAQNVDDVYYVTNAGNLFWLAQQMNSSAINTNVNISLSTDVDMESKTFIGFKDFKGTFDGQNKSISGFARTSSTTDNTNGFGFFNKTTNATIKELTIGGKLTITGSGNKSAYLGGLVGIANGTSFVDVTSSIGIETDNTVDGATANNRIRIVGGMVGSMVGGSMNRCRYNGKMTLDASNDQIGDRFGGLIGLMQTTASTIDNCLFDGTITANKNSIIIGGLVGNGLAGSTIKNSLAAGKMNLTSINTNCGMLIGSTKPSTFTNNHYIKDCIKVGGNAVLSGYNDAGTPNDGTNWVGLQNTLNGGVQTLECNWKVDSGQAWPIPMKWSNNHTHTWDANGFCVDGDGGYQSLDEPTDGTYTIANGGQLLDFATKVNDGTISFSSNAKLTADVNLNNVEFPGIGAYAADASTAYSGTFDGQGFTISGYNRKVTSGNQQGFFNYAKGATIKDFTLEGTMTDSGTGQQHGSVIGWADAGTTVEDVHSSVNVTITSTATQVGGFVGRAGGTFNRCSYSGKVSTSTAYDKIGGFAGTLLNGTITNSLFDGQLLVSTNNESLKAGGFAGAVIEKEASLSNSLVNGTIDISHKTENCGVIIGYADKNVAFTNALYTTTEATKQWNAIGTVSKATVNGTAKNVTSESWENVSVMLNPSEGSVGNWKIKTGDGAKTYPVPMLVNDFSHTHVYKNGFCITDDGNYEAAIKDNLDGYYQVTNAGNLWWLMEQINSTDKGTLAKDVKIKLTGDIDMEDDAHGSFPGICPLGSYTEDGKQVDDWSTAFQGVFDGKGYTINNYYRLHDVSGIRRGLINSAKDATIRHFKINGNVKITTTGAELALSGVVIGSASGSTKIEDIHSNVNVNSPAALIRGYGGVAGALEDKMNTASVTMNRCRYSGTMTLGGDKSNQNIGGVVGELRSAVMKNCLFDGTITVASAVPYTFVGGLVGKVGTSDNSEIHRSLVHGTITLNGYSELTAEQKTAKNCGIVIGGADHTIYMNKVFHTTTNVTAGLGIIGTHTTTKEIKNENDGIVGTTITVDLLLGTSTDKTTPEEGTELYSTTFRTTLGEPNWKKVTEGYTYPYKDEGHIHKYRNGFCTSGDGEYQSANETNNTYQINNGGKLYWFAEQFNAGNIPQDATVEIMNNIDMEGTDYIYPGIGTSDRRFKGTFNGHGYTISNYHRDIINSECTGLINYATGATIQSFKLSGTTNFNLATTKSFHGTVLGMGLNEPKSDEFPDGKEMLIEDIASSVRVHSENQFVRVWGGIAGRSAGRINRCRFSGIFGNITSSSSVGKSHSGEQIGGICANAKEAILIENCLFDGTIKSACTVPKMRVSGILSSNEKGTGAVITIKNCLFNGCLELSHSYTDPTGVSEEKDANGNYIDPLKKATENGIIAGYLDSNKPSVINNIYYLNSCEGMDDIPLGDFNKVPNSTSSNPGNEETWMNEKDVVTKIEGTPNNEQWNEIFKKLDEYKEEVDAETGETIVTRNHNWEYNVTEAGTGTHETIPVPISNACTHQLPNGTSAFNQFGWCTLCGERRPLQQDEDGRYQMTYVSDLATFRDMVNSASDDSSTQEFNAVLTQDIDFSEFPGELGDPIGNDFYNRYLYNFDGNGYTIKNIRVTADKSLIGMFGFAGNKDHDCKIHDFTITGTINVPYSSEEHDDEPLCIGVVGKMYRGEIYNVHSQLTIKNTNETKAYVGGILGSAETEEVGQEYGVTISKCSYTGACEVNAYGDMGGIVGRVSRNTLIRDCTFAGTMNHVYTGEANQTLFGGVVGYNESEDFGGIKNCVIAGMMKTGKTSTGADREFVAYGTPGNHKNSLCGEDKVITNIYTTNTPNLDYEAKYSNNYALNVYKPLISANSVVEATYKTQEQFASGEICAALNAIDSNPSYDPFEEISTENAVGYPWGQILGYQVGDLTKGQLIGNHTDGSPAQRVPFPGYQNPEKKTYKVTATTNDTDESKKDYLADWYYFDDAGDTTPFPSDASTMKVKRIDYTRDKKYLIGFISMCLPFNFTADMKPSEDTKLYTYNGCSGNIVYFTEATEVTKGIPFIMYDESGKDWKPFTDASGNAKINNSGTDIALTVSNPTALTFDKSNKVNNSSLGNGIYGTFNTITLGEGYYKINSDGTKLVKTTNDTNGKGNPSHCFPYRVFLKLPGSSSGTSEAPYRIIWGDDSPTSLESLDVRFIDADTKCYNVQGQRVNPDTKGIVIMNGKKYFNK